MAKRINKLSQHEESTWCVIDLKYDEYSNILLNVVDWIELNLIGEYFYRYFKTAISELGYKNKVHGRSESGIRFYFKSKEDAMAFKLRYR